MSLWVVFPPHNASQSPVQHYHFLYLTSLFPTISRSTVVVGQLVGFWAAAPEGTRGDKVLWNTGGICTSVRTYVHLSVRPSPP